MAKIAYVVNSLNLGGAENLVVQMSLAFSSTHSVMVICLDEPGLWADKLRTAGIPVYCVYRQDGLDFHTALRLAALTRKYDIDIIHAHQCTAWFYAALSRLLFRKPKLLFEEHGRHYPEVRSVKKIIVNKLLVQHLTHYIVAVSHDLSQRLIEFEGVSLGRIKVIYNGIESPLQLSEEKRVNLRKGFGVLIDEFLVGSVGRLDHIKNYPLLLQTFAELITEYPKAKLMLVGEGPEREHLQNLAEELAIVEKVIFTGYRQDATDLLQAFDLFVLCSFSEGTSMALLEAMATGLPSVVTDVGGNSDLITSGESGWVVNSDDKHSLLIASKEAIGDCRKARKYALNARTRFDKQFTFDRMISGYQNLYLSMVG
jgi:glycosyltransferase involved in cell wall biosynthesis